MMKTWMHNLAIGGLLLGSSIVAMGCEHQQASAQPATEPEATAIKGGDANTEAVPTPTEDKVPVVAETEPANTGQVAKAPVPSREELEETYVWLEGRDDLEALTTLSHEFSPPNGFTRVEVEAKSYQAYLRGLPMRTDRTSVKLYNGDPVSMPSKGIIPLDLGKRDLHQCADSVIRLYAEWLWVSDRATEAQFHFTSGDLARWKDWRAGKVLKVKGGKVVQVKTKAAPNTHSAYRRWLDRVFTYASTRSMHRDSKRIEDPKELQAGDFFLMGGSPGHVVILLDVAESKSGERVALVGQGYLPAREFHVIEGGSSEAIGGVWFKLPSDANGELSTPTWKPFGMEHAWRFR